MVIGLDEDAPFRAALGQIKALLDTLGVEGTVAKIKPAEPDGPIIPRDYEVGLQPGTDRLRACPSNAKCLIGTRGEKIHPALRVLRPEGRRRRQLVGVVVLGGGRDPVWKSHCGVVINRHRHAVEQASRR